MFITVCVIALTLVLDDAAEDVADPVDAVADPGDGDARVRIEMTRSGY